MSGSRLEIVSSLPNNAAKSQILVAKAHRTLSEESLTRSWIAGMTTDIIEDLLMNLQVSGSFETATALTCAMKASASKAVMSYLMHLTSGSLSHKSFEKAIKKFDSLKSLW